MRLRVKDQVLPFVDFNSACLLHLVELQQQGRAVVDGGLGMSALTRNQRDLAAYSRAVQVRQKAVEDGEPVGEEPDPPDCAPVMMGVTAFLTLRAAGEKLTLMDALLLSPGDLEQVSDPEDIPAGEGDGADPTAPGSDGPATPAGDASGPAPE